MGFKGLATAFVLALCAAVLFPGCATKGITPVQEATAHYKMGLNRMQSGNDEAALYEFQKAIEKDPRNYEAHFAAGIIYHRQQNYDTAIAEFKKAISLNPEYSDAHNNLGLSLVKKERYEEAIEEFVIAADEPMSRTRFPALINIGATYDLMEQHEKSAQSYREALLIQPYNSMAMARLAGQYVKLGNTGEAVKYYNKSIEINPDNEVAHYELGLLYYKSGQNSEALASFLKVVELAPGSDLASNSENYIRLIK